jgi:hypothetical protein
MGSGWSPLDDARRWWYEEVVNHTFQGLFSHHSLAVEPYPNIPYGFPDER